MTSRITWYFSRALGVIGLFAGALQVAVAAILGEGAGELLASVGTGILLAVGGMLIGATIDAVIQARRRARSRDGGRGGHSRKR